MSGDGGGEGGISSVLGFEDAVEQKIGISIGEGGVDGGTEAEEGNLGFEVFDLALKLFLCLARLLVALLARPSVLLPILLPARLAPHSHTIHR